MANTGSKSPSFTYTAPPEDLLSPIWTLRLFPPAILLGVILAEFVFKTGFFHGCLLGLSCGLLTSLAIVGFQITGISMRKDQTRSDVDNLRITA